MKTRAVEVMRYAAGHTAAAGDELGVEEPLELRLGTWHDGRLLHRNLVVTMRTPGHDAELAAGFLLTEGILSQPAQIAEIAPWDPALPNVWRVDLTPGVTVDWKRLERLTYAASSCGLCGKASIEMVAARLPAAPLSECRFPAAMLLDLPARLRASQAAFASTGSLHAAAFFTPSGELRASYEDVGRHNAVDKLIGRLWRAEESMREGVMLVSGRAGFELVQKAAMAGVAAMAAVGAPSSLAVELAETTGMTLVGFLRDQRFNVYSGAQRIVT